MTVKFDREKALNAVLYISNMIGEADFHKIFKTLYFAEQKHLSKYGKLITGDTYIAMRNGAVPSIIYDIFKKLGGRPSFINDPELINIFGKNFIVKERFYILPLTKPDIEIFSESEIECFDESITENKELSFNEISDKSHNGLAYKNAAADDMLSFIDIAREGNANGEMIKYMDILSENNSPLHATPSDSR